MALGLGVLRLAPDDFWRMTIPELRAAQRGLAGRAGGPARRYPSRARLEEMKARYPDAPASEARHGE